MAPERKPEFDLACRSEDAFRVYVAMSLREGDERMGKIATAVSKLNTDGPDHCEIGEKVAEKVLGHVDDHPVGTGNGNSFSLGSLTAKGTLATLLVALIMIVLIAVVGPALGGVLVAKWFGG